METKEQKLEAQLRAIKVEKRKKAEAAFDKWQKDIKKERTIQLIDGVYNLAFGPDYDQDQLSPEKVITLLENPATLVRHDWDGNVLDVYNRISVVKNSNPKSVFEPRDKGRPSIVLCEKGKAVFSFSVYEDGLKGQELVVYSVSEIHAW